MGVKTGPFAKGDWIVHAFYGVGQITSVVKKPLGEQVMKYYEVKAVNSIFFVPVDNAENSRVRPVASKYKLRKVVKLLKEEPIELETNHTNRKKEISERISDGSVESTAELVRDLNARRVGHGLNDYDNKILEDLTTRLVREWAIAQDIEEEKAHEKLAASLEGDPIE